MTTKKSKKGRVRTNITDRHIAAVQDFLDEPGMSTVIWDNKVQELRLRIGRHRVTWSWFAERKRRGHRSTICRRLGHWPAMSTNDARKAAKLLSGKVVDGSVETAKRALGFTEAWDDYLRHLHDKAVSAGKEPIWHRIAENLGRLYLKPQWDGWTLREVSRDPRAVREWHQSIKSKVIANKCAKLLRACYRFAGKLRRELPAELPTSGVTMHPEEPAEAGMTEKQHRAWAAAWREIEAPGRKAYHLLAILTGQRPGELGRLRVSDLHDDHLAIPKAKAGLNIWVPYSPAIERAIKMALKARGDNESEWLFPARAGGHIRRFDSDGLPLWGNGLRHNFKTIATLLQIDEMLRDFLQGHVAKGVARKYVSTMVLAKSNELCGAQARISDRIVALLGLTASDLT